MANPNIKASAVGVQAYKILSSASKAAILGITSRGIFLQVNDRWVVFISYETYRGPLTLNINQYVPPPGSGETRSVEIHNHRIRIPALNLIVRFQDVEVYSPPACPPTLDLPEIRQRIRAVAQNVIMRKGMAGGLPFLAYLVNGEIPIQPEGTSVFSHMDIPQITKALRSADPGTVITQLQSFLGVGSGLTPSGDDLVTGFLLVRNRYQDLCTPPASNSLVNIAVVEQAYQKTSLLSANLMECAIQGQADERLIQALDGMLAGTLDPASCANLLLSWGSTSGCDALTGMALAVYPNPPG